MAGLQGIFGLLWLIDIKSVPIAACSRIQQTGIFTRAWSRDLLFSLASESILTMAVIEHQTIPETKKKHAHLHPLQKGTNPEKVFTKCKPIGNTSHPGGELLEDFLRNINISATYITYDSWET